MGTDRDILYQMAFDTAYEAYRRFERAVAPYRKRQREITNRLVKIAREASRLNSKD